MRKPNRATRISALLLERRAAKKTAGELPNGQDLDKIQRETFLNINRDYGSTGSDLDGQGRQIKK